jgi:hypothetical protein
VMTMLLALEDGIESLCRWPATVRDSQRRIAGLDRLRHLSSATQSPREPLRVGAQKSGAGKHIHDTPALRREWRGVANAQAAGL